ncbi:MAG: 30S ribosomal protein S8e [Candidatus Woesearchaeota archaeon]
MVVSHYKSKRAPSGAMYKKARGRRLAELGRTPSLTRIGEQKTKVVRTRGGNTKKRLLSGDTANVYNPKSKKHEIIKILNVVESPADINYVRRNIMVKGTILQTENGKAKITNSPGQDGMINAVMLE